MLKIIKIGGKLIENGELLNKLCDSLVDFAPDFVLVHGGGLMAGELATKLGIEVKMHEGRRITDKATLDIAVMAYAGLANKRVVAALQQRGINACGLSGCDMRCVTSHKRPVKDIDWGYVGDIDKVNGEMLTTLLKQQIIPVISPITSDGGSQLLNTNADSVASEVAKEMARHTDNVEMVFCMDKCGVLEDINDDNSTIPIITRKKYAELLESGKIFSGMLPKLENAYKLIDAGVTSVRLTNPDNLNGGTLVIK